MHIPSFKTFPPHHQPTSSPLGAQTPAARQRAPSKPSQTSAAMASGLAGKVRRATESDEFDLSGYDQAQLDLSDWLGCPVVPRIPGFPSPFWIIRIFLGIQWTTFISPLGFLGGLVPKGLRLRRTKTFQKKRPPYVTFSPKKHQSIFLKSYYFCGRVFEWAVFF